MHVFRRDGRAAARMVICASVTQTGRIRVYCGWFWLVCWWLWVVLGHFGWFRGLVTTSVGDTSWKQSYYRMKVIQNFQLFIFINEGHIGHYM